MVKRRRPNQRGVSLLEGMMASLVLLFGLVGVLNGVIFAMRQNSTATKMVRAGAIATRVRASLTNQGAERVRANTSGSCTTGLFSDTTQQQYLDGFTAASVSGYTLCAMNLGNFEDSSTPATTVDSSTRAHDREVFQVMLVRFDNSTTNRTEGVTIIVSWLDGLTRRSHSQYVAFYDPTVFKVGNL